MSNFFTIFSRTCLIVLFLNLMACQSKRPEYRSPDIKVEPIVARNISPQALGQEQPKVKVAMLLPLSGEHHILGEELLNSAQMCLFENNGDNIELLIYDTKGNAAVAVEMARTAIAQEAKLIIGPVYSNEATAIKQVTAAAGVPVLSLSNNQSIAQAPLFTFGFGYKDQILKLVQLANQQGITRLGALVPKSEYGQLIKKELEVAALSSGLPEPYIKDYDNATTDFSSSAKGFKDAKVKGIIIPEGGQKLRLIVSGLIYGNLKDVKFLGTGQWDTPDVNFDTTLLGGWFVASPIEPRINFESRFEKMFGKTPKRIATLAYDAASLAIKAVDSQTGQINQALLTDQRGFAGVDGIFRLKQNGQVERDLSVYEITESGLKKIG